MFVFACKKCRYTDLYEEDETAYCPRCGGSMVSLGVSSADWNRLDTEEIYELIFEKVGNGEDTSGQRERADAPEEQETVRVATGTDPVPITRRTVRVDSADLRSEASPGYSYKEYLESQKPKKKNVGSGIILTVIVAACIALALGTKYREKGRILEPVSDTSVLDPSALQTGDMLSDIGKEYPVYEFENCLYYDSMSEKEKEIYRLYYDLVMHKDEEDYSRKLVVPVSELEDTEDKIELVFYAMLRDHPEFFFISVSDSRLPQIESYTDKEAAVYEIRLGPPELDENEMIAKFDNAVYNFMRSIDKKASCDEIELQIHDKLNNMVSYDRQLLELGLYGPDLAHTAYGALVENSRGNAHTAVCDGYAQAYQYLLKQVGICAAQVTGDADTPQGTLWGDAYHAWNIVELDGEWYEVDCCWDDLEIDELNDFYLEREIKNLDDKYFYVTHHWFNRTTEEMEHLPASERTRFFIPGYKSFNFIEETSHIRQIRPEEEWYRSFKYLNDRLPIANGTKYSL